MNFESLSTLVQGLIKTFKCPDCSTEINTSNIEIIGAAGTTINIDICCNECGRHSMIKSEVLSVNLTDYINQTKTNNILQNHTRKTKLVNNIQDKQIIELNSKLKNKSLTINDLLK